MKCIYSKVYVTRCEQNASTVRWNGQSVRMAKKVGLYHYSLALQLVSKVNYKQESAK